MESILTSIKKLLGIEEDYEHFDADIIIHINSVFMILNQLGVGPTNGFIIEDKTATWQDFLSDAELINLSAVKSFIHLHVRLLFDPPTSTAVVESINKLIREYEWRLNISADSSTKEVNQNG